MMMTPNCTAAIAALVLVLTTGAARAYDSGCPTDSDPITTDRPNVVNSPVVVPAGSLQLENGLTWTQTERSQVLDGTETVMRLGLVRCTEFQLLVPTYNWSFGGRAASGFGNIGLAFKHQLGPLPLGFELAAAAGLEFPSGATAVSGPGYNPFMQFSWAHDLAYGFSLQGMFAVTWFTEQPEQNPTFEPTGAILKQLGDHADALIEYFGDYDHQRPSQLLDTGATYRFTERQQVDFQAGLGLNSASPDHFFGIGYSVPFDRVF
jgi:hypothetical protein